MLMIFVACSPPQHDHVTAGQAFTKRYAIEMRRENNWWMFGFGGGYLNDINELSFKFIAHEQLELNEARRLIVENIEHLYELINNDPELSPYLTETPFGRKRITLGVMFFKTGTMDYVDPPFIDNVICVDGKIRYSTQQKDKNNLNIAYRETYEEAYEIVQQQQQGLDSVNAQPIK